MKQSTVRKLPAPVTAEAGDRELLLKIVGFYQDAFNQSPEAQRYLESRGLKSAEMVERFRLGFANRTLGLCLPAKNRADGAAVRGAAGGVGHLPEERPRAFQRLAGYPGDYASR